MEQQPPLTESESQPQETASPEKSSGSSKLLGIGLTIIAILILIGVTIGVIALAQADNSTTSRIRDIFIVLMALESLVLGVALIVLIVQLAILINLIQNEIKPILDSTSDTVHNLRGTAVFLSNNLVEPVIKLNATLAGFKKAFDILRPNRK